MSSHAAVVVDVMVVDVSVGSVVEDIEMVEAAVTGKLVVVVVAVSPWQAQRRL
jgi:hypothetical protein